jgi:colanic acid/amylovoran biosynthesis glycosyltransferase
MTSPRVAYLTTAYPYVSHTFIRREIVALERLGYGVTRVAIRAGDAVVDADDVAEDAKTLHLLGQSKGWLLRHGLCGAVLAGGALLAGLGAAWRLSKASERGLVRHLAYFVEALCLMAYLRTQGTEHVHVHFGTNAAAVALLMKLMGGPSYSMTIHGPDEFDAPIGLSLGWKAREALFTVAITRFCDAQLRRWLAVADWHKLHVVGCTVDEEWFDAARPVDEGARDIVCVGRLSKQKGQLVLLDALAEAVARGFTGRLVLVGDGPLRDEIEGRANELDLSAKVRITGWADACEVRRALLDARTLVLSSFAEGLPVVIMEAMALQRPTVCTSIMGIPELVIPGENGWLAVTGDASALAEAIVQADQTPLPRLREMGIAAQDRVRGEHCSGEIAKLDSLFRGYLGHEGARDPQDSDVRPNVMVGGS